MLKKHYLASLVCGLSVAALSTTATAHSAGLGAGPWGMGGSVGYTSFSSENGGASSVVGRFHLNKELKESQNRKFKLGLEAGVQNGNYMNMQLTTAQLADVGGIQPWSTVNFMADILASFKYKPKEESKAFLIVKGGAMYRQWHSGSAYINDLTAVGGEVQAGIGAMVSEKVEVSVVYQGVYGGNPNMKQVVAATTVTPQLMNVANIPVQNGVLLDMTAYF